MKLQITLSDVYQAYRLTKGIREVMRRLFIGLASGALLLYCAAYAYTIILFYLEVFHGS